MRKFALTYLWISSVALLGACGAPPEPGASPGTMEDSLAVVQLSPTYSVHFREIAPGEIVIVEEGAIDAHDTPTNFDNLLSLSLPEAFARIAPGQPVPAALTTAETRRAARRARGTSPPAKAVAPPITDSVSHVVKPSRSGAQAALITGDGPVATHTQAIEWDWEGERRWFEANFCSWTAADSVWCPTNASYASTSWRATMYYQTTLMNADFDAYTTGSIDRWSCSGGCSWVRHATPIMAPRYWYRYTFETVGWYRSAASGARIHLSERFRHATPPFTAISDYPFDRSFDPANDMQGVTHDSNYWYFTNAHASWPWPLSSIWRVPVGTDLNQTPTLTRNPWFLIYNHFGDLVHVDGKLYVALEADGGGGPGGAIGVFNTALQPIGYRQIPGPQGSSVPWIAYNPKDRLFYSSSFDTWYLDRYRISVAADNTVNISHEGWVDIRDSNGNPTFLNRVQGGKFSASGKLYLSQDIQGGGIVVIDPNNGRIQQRIPVQFDRDGEDEELEGLDIWDLEDGRAPGVRGHVHVLMVQNDTYSNDNWYFKHFRVTNPGRL